MTLLGTYGNVSISFKIRRKRGLCSDTNTVVNIVFKYYFMEEGAYEGKSVCVAPKTHNVTLSMV